MTDTMTLHAAFARHIATALDALEAAGTLPAGLNRSAVAVEPPRDPSHGDLATNAAMVLAKPAGLNPRALAEALVSELTKLPGVGNIKSSFALKQVKYQTALPLPVAAVAPKAAARRKGKK